MYELLDSGNGKKWERFGPYIICRPAPQAVWRPQKQIEADATFSREATEKWQFRTKLEKQWEVEIDRVRFLLMLTNFGHLGVFPEHAALWNWTCSKIRNKDRILNLFAYSGGATLAAAGQGAQVCHVDASKGMVDWARKNAQLNGLEKAPIRWIVDDVLKFLKREVKRKSFYEGIILDPPTFGRGNKGEVFKIEDSVMELLDLCKQVLSDQAKFLLFTCHTPGFTPIVLKQMLMQVFQKDVENDEMLLKSKGFSIPSGAYARISF